jgi:hypothetical protein
MKTEFLKKYILTSCVKTKLPFIKNAYHITPTHISSVIYIVLALLLQFKNERYLVAVKHMDGKLTLLGE